MGSDARPASPPDLNVRNERGQNGCCPDRRTGSNAEKGRQRGRLSAMPERIAIIGSRDYSRPDLGRAFFAQPPAGGAVGSGGAPGIETVGDPVEVLTN